MHFQRSLARGDYCALKVADRFHPESPLVPTSASFVQCFELAMPTKETPALYMWRQNRMVSLSQKDAVLHRSHKGYWI